MSDSKKFGKELNPKSLERLKNFELIERKLVKREEFNPYRDGQEKIQKDLQVLIEKLKPLDDSFSELHQKCDSISKKLVHLGKDISRLDTRLVEQDKILNQFHEKGLEQEKNWANELAQLKDDILKLHNASKNFIGKVEFGTLYSKLTDLMNDVRSHQREMEEVDKSFNWVKEELHNRKEELVGMIDSTQDYWAQMEKMISDMAEASKYEGKEIDRIKKSLNFLIENTPKEIDERIEAIKFPSPGMNPEEAKAYLYEKFYPISLESKNTALRSSNNEMKLNLLEKKLDQLSVVVKRFELKEG